MNKFELIIIAIAAILTIVGIKFSVKTLIDTRKYYNKNTTHCFIEIDKIAKNYATEQSKINYENHRKAS